MSGNQKVGKQSRSVRRNQSRKASKAMRLVQNQNTVAAERSVGIRVGVFPGVGFPDALHMSLRYEQAITLSGTPTSSAQVFRLNSLFDPDLTGAGHQPSQYDQVCALYTEYLVEHCNVEIELFNGGSAAARVVIAACETNNSSATVDSIAEQTYSWVKILGPGTGGNAYWKFIHRFNMRKLLGQVNIDSDPNLYTPNNANPQDIVYAWMKATALDGASSFNVYGTIRFVYHSKFKELIVPTASLRFDTPIGVGEACPEKTISGLELANCSSPTLVDSMKNNSVAQTSVNDVIERPSCGCKH